VLFQQPPHFAFAGPDATGEQPTAVLRTHIGRR
jgi:hypothetical protein